jgi:hypothetical protein
MVAWSCTVGKFSWYTYEVPALTSVKPISNDAVLLTYETERSYPNGSKRRVLRSSVWKHDGLKWQMFFHQGTIRP